MVWGNKSQGVKNFGTKPKHFVHRSNEGTLLLRLSSERQRGGGCQAQRVLSVKLHRYAAVLRVPPEQKTQEPGAQPKMCLEVIEVEITKVLSSVTPKVTCFTASL